jgi:uncharacterized membrane protein YhiD involved in acid resistance
VCVQALKAQLASLTLAAGPWATHAVVAAAAPEASMPAAAATAADDVFTGALPELTEPVLPLAAAVQQHQPQQQYLQLHEQDALQQQQPLEEPLQEEQLQEEQLQEQQFQFGAGSSYMDTTDPVTMMYLNATSDMHS